MISLKIKKIIYNLRKGHDIVALSTLHGSRPRDLGPSFLVGFSTPPFSPPFNTLRPIHLLSYHTKFMGQKGMEEGINRRKKVTQTRTESEISNEYHYTTLFHSQVLLCKRQKKLYHILATGSLIFWFLLLRITGRNELHVPEKGNRKSGKLGNHKGRQSHNNRIHQNLKNHTEAHLMINMKFVHSFKLGAQVRNPYGE